MGTEISFPGRENRTYLEIYIRTFWKTHGRCFALYFSLDFSQWRSGWRNGIERYYRTVDWTILDLISKTQRGCYSITLAYTPEHGPIYLARFCANPRPETDMISSAYYGAVDWGHNRLRGIGSGEDIERVKSLCYNDMLACHEEPLSLENRKPSL